MVGTALLQPVLDLYTVIKIHVYYKHLSFIVIFQTLKVSTNNTIMVKKCIFNVYVNYAKTWPLDVAKECQGCYIGFIPCKMCCLCQRVFVFLLWFFCGFFSS